MQVNLNQDFQTSSTGMTHNPRIEAIKIIRRWTGLSLGECKKIIDQRNKWVTIKLNVTSTSDHIRNVLLEAFRRDIREADIFSQPKVQHYYDHPEVPGTYRYMRGRDQFWLEVTELEGELVFQNRLTGNEPMKLVEAQNLLLFYSPPEEGCCCE